MNSHKPNIVVALGGASGSLYGKLLLDKLVTLNDQWENVGIIISDNAKINWKIELGDPLEESNYPF